MRGKLSKTECEMLSALHNHKREQIPQTFKTCKHTKEVVYKTEGNKTKCQKCSIVARGR